LDDLDSCLNWLRCFAALLTYEDPAAAAAGPKKLFFGVPDRGACIGAAARAEGEDVEGISQYRPCRLAFLSQLPRLQRALSLGLHAYAQGSHALFHALWNVTSRFRAGPLPVEASPCAMPFSAS
jgi:hypothetical protein